MPHVEAPGNRFAAVLAVAICALCAGASSVALAVAQAAGDEVPGFENEYTKAFANADGSYTAEIHTVPINFRNAEV